MEYVFSSLVFVFAMVSFCRLLHVVVFACRCCLLLLLAATGLELLENERAVA
jgi:hypothetical protein